MHDSFASKRLRALCVSSFISSLLLSIAVAEESWPRFRGLTATGVSADDARLPDHWTQTENVAWSVDVPGWGWSCPIVTDGKVFVTAVTSDDEYDRPKKGLYLGRGRKEPPQSVHHWLVYCIDVTTGKELWKRQVYEGAPTFPRHPKSTYASETMATDGKRVFALFGDLGLYAFDLGGSELWRREIDAQDTFFDYGAAASPIVYDGQVIMVYDNQDASYIASYDVETGAQNWRTPRETTSTWATPYVWKNSQRTEIIASGKRSIHSYDLDGQELWHFVGDTSNLIIPSPFAVGDLLYVTSGYVGDKHRPVYVFAPGADGEITVEDKAVKWHLPQGGPYNTSPIVYRGRYYTLYDRGFMTCHDAETGEEVYGKTRFPGGASFTASPWAYNGRIFCLSEDGETFVVRAGDEFEVLATNSLDELSLATPATADGKLLLRTAGKLYCITKKTDS